MILSKNAMILTNLQYHWEHLKKCWISCLLCTILFASWQYSVGIPLLSFQTLFILLVIPFTFAFSDYTYIDYKNRRRKLSKPSQRINMFFMGLALALSSIMTAYRDAFRTDTFHYLIYFCIAALWLVLLSRAANKE